MKMSDITKLEKGQASQKVKELRRELFELKFSGHTGTLEKPHFLKSLRKDIARLLTHVNAK